MGGAAATTGVRAQPGRREVGGVAGASQWVGVGVVQDVAVLGDEDEDHPVHQPQQGLVQRGHVDVRAQRGVVGMAQEPGAQGGDGLLHAVAQLVERAGAGGDGFDAPLLQPARRGRGALVDREAGNVQQPVEQHELAEQLAVKDGFQVELDVGRRGERARVAQQPQLAAVGDHAPQVGLGAVQAFLHQRLRGHGARSAGPLVQVGVPRGQVHRHVVPAVADREGLGSVVGRDPGPDRGQHAEAERVEQGCQPVRERRPRRVRRQVGLRSGRERLAQLLPQRSKVVPVALRFVADGAGAGDAVVGRLATAHVLALGDADQHVGGQQAPDGVDRGEHLVAGDGGHQAAPPETGR